MEEITPQPESFIPRLLRLSKSHLWEFYCLFLLAFIPLYPKLPLIEPIRGYIVRIRLEDLLIALALAVFGLRLLVGKVRLQDQPLFKPVAVYLLIGFISTLSALAVTKTVPLSLPHVLKLYLHFLRRIEYFFLSFLFFSLVTDLGVVKRATAVFGVTVLGVTGYGFGQKYLAWPAFSTMNREFAKGWKLYLTEHARVMSTFGGHYDLGAFLVLALALFIALAFLAKSRLGKWLSLVIFGGAYLLLLMTASRASFIAYLIAVSLLILVLVSRKGILWGISRWTALISVSLLLLVTFGSMAERFGNLAGKGGLGHYLDLILVRYRPSSTSVSVGTDKVASLADQPPRSARTPADQAWPEPGREKPSDVYENVPAKIEEVIVYDDQNRPQVVRRVVPRQYSETALRYDLSSAIRFDVLWPRAWQGFLRNPLLGSGYSTLTKAEIADFSEAESTDNEYLRTLGETGLLGFLALAWIFLTLGRQIRVGLKYLDNPLVLALSAGLGAATVGLLVNAFYIDVLEASKVAEPYWAWTGLVLGALHLSLPKRVFRKKEPRKTPAAFLILTLLLLGGLAVRLYRIDAPLADWHSWRQADTAAVARNFARNGIDLLRPRFDDLSSVPSGLANPEGYRFVEFPLQGALITLAYRVGWSWSLEIWGRLVSIGFSLLSAGLLYLLVQRYSGARIALLSTFFFLFLPFNIYYSRTILPEPLLVFFSLASLYLFDLLIGGWGRVDLSTRSRLAVSIILSGGAVLATAVALLLKPVAVFYGPVILVRLWQKRPGQLRFWLGITALVALACLPFGLWRLWISHFPEGIPAWDWLLNGSQIRFQPAWFRWLFAERLGKIIFGYWGSTLFILGLLIRPSRQEGWLYHLWLASGLAYLVILATGNVTHDYYQVILIPMIAVILAKGVDFLLFGAGSTLVKPLVWLVTPVLIVSSLGFSWYQVRDFFNINNPAIVEAGKAVDTLAPPDAKVIAPYGGDTAFLYQTRRRGWPVGGDIPGKMVEGANFYVAVDLQSDEVQDLKKKFVVAEETGQYVIIQLIPKK